MNLTDLSITEAIRLLRKREISAGELVRAHIGAMEARRDLNAFITETADIAAVQAQESDKRYADGSARPLDGIPLGIKDLFCTKGVLTTAASRMLANFTPGYESTVTERLFSAGAAMLGKTGLDEFAMGSTTKTSYFGPVKNPYSRGGEFLVPGGSSGGSAAAVAAGLCMAATGTDTGGSIRQPAAFCGIVGLKPTYGRVSRHGVVAFASSLDCPGMMTRTVADQALTLQAIAGPDERDGTSCPDPAPDYSSFIGRPARGMRIGIPREYISPDLDRDVQKYWDKTADDLKAQGCEVVNVSLPHTKYAMAAYYIIAPAEAMSNLSRYDGVKYGFRAQGPFQSLDDMYEKTRSQGFSAEVKRRILIGAAILTEEFYERSFLKAMKVRRLLLQDFERAFEKCDAILTPAAPTTAFSKDADMTPIEVWLSDIYTITANLAGLPAISLPAGLSSDGLPIGMQFIGPAFAEGPLLQLASAAEEARGFSNRPSEAMR
ncbi:MAG: Asp-tRNA(Asn)/Glu-tRNA(Gln) amidotransferase subunit GatA [Rickettsiales bacterium]|jgi:aspartyl-tRNA(Asn)/glutamyl-tRNA(Gln) amidotransferase subunit A|nr:Asp-tRNA(Asn)/Glu-tRNA(Gln) amidotransferase subunit GatA [Rickettsiales bacterium]